MRPRPLLLPLLLLLACAAHTVGALPRLCDVLQVLREERDQCLQELSKEKPGDPGVEQPAPGCEGLWDNMSCWPSSALGQTVEVGCPQFLRMLTGRNGSVFRNCTEDGWSEAFPRPDLACGVNVNDSSNEKRHEYLLKLKVMYTVGYSSSLVMLLVALSVLCAFRRLHCTRNYIHMHLFVSFILRALSNFIKDAVLFSSDDVAHCDAHRVGCKLVMAFFQYCIMANYAWLLVEGLYLHTLLVISFFSEKKCLQGFVALGWGSPAVFVASWAISRHFLEDVGCWDINANASIWWVIRGPVILSILINFILFINILRILMRKLRTQETRGNEANHYKPGLCWGKRDGVKKGKNRLPFHPSDHTCLVGKKTQALLSETSKAETQVLINESASNRSISQSTSTPPPLGLWTCCFLSETYFLKILTSDSPPHSFEVWA
uniref:Secretin receptor n=1 Tax=Lynx canadensis TaxID=61383 RepID=A0A667G697_LYNCA